MQSLKKHLYKILRFYVIKNISLVLEKTYLFIILLEKKTELNIFPVYIIIKNSFW